ncbi:MAG: exo-alpha-sialidase [Chitinophagaceae bacterium]|nr:MAG: exo-alpha-sialidase [Chitinophagaceae bacterium]
MNKAKIFIFFCLCTTGLLSISSAVQAQYLDSVRLSAPADVVHNTPLVLAKDNKLSFEFGKERMVIPDGLQPSMLTTKAGTIIVQSQNSKKPLPQQRIFYPYAMTTVISRDKGETWNEFSFPKGSNGVDIEGGAIQLRNGKILAMETYVTPGKAADEGIGIMYTSTNDWRTLQGPVEIKFHIPDADFYSSTDDGGRPHAAMRLHRRIIELPNGDLLTTIYGWQKGDNEPAGYIPTMKKTRVMLFRSKDKGMNWDYVSTVAAEKGIGTEGFGEPVINRVNKGTHEGRLISLMRTGRELYKTISDDNGKTWSKPEPIVFAERDVYATDQWKEMFKDTKRKGELIVNNPNEIIGAVVDPDLLSLRSGILVAAFGVRIPARANWQNPTHPWNGNYLAFSTDGGDTWGNILQLTSGIFTTHYMAIEETNKDNNIFVAYDFGHWTNKTGRYTYGRRLAISIMKK